MGFNRTNPHDLPKVPPRCSCTKTTHGHTVPCFRPKYGRLDECLHCIKETTCTKEHLVAELRKRCRPFYEYHQKMEKWDGGCALPDSPSNGEIADFLEAYDKLTELIGEP
jgi:hypothetical protein